MAVTLTSFLLLSVVFLLCTFNFVVCFYVCAFYLCICAGFVIGLSCLKQTPKEKITDSNFLLL